MYHINHERQKKRIISINNEKSDNKIAHNWEVKGNMQTYLSENIGRQPQEISRNTKTETAMGRLQKYGQGNIAIWLDATGAATWGTKWNPWRDLAKTCRSWPWKGPAVEWLLHQSHPRLPGRWDKRRNSLKQVNDLAERFSKATIHPANEVIIRDKIVRPWAPDSTMASSQSSECMPYPNSVPNRPNIADRKNKYLSFPKSKSWWAIMMIVVVTTPKLLCQPFQR